MATDYRNPIFRQLKGYTPGEQPSTDGWIKLNTNENPFAPSPRVKEKLLELAGDTSRFRRYPNAMGEPLRSALANKFHLDKENVLVSNGSDEALALLCKITLEPGDTVASPEYTYSLYETLVRACSAKIEYVPMKNGFSADLDSLVRTNAKIIFFPNPNAPTGEFTQVTKLLEAVSKSKALWVIDEAYNDFVDNEEKSFAPYLSRHQNCAVVRTFSKSHALAGQRIGYLLSANSYLMEGLQAAKDSYNEDMISIHLGLAAISDDNWLKETVQVVIEQRKKLESELQNLEFRVIPSQSNFILCEPPKSISATEILEELKTKKILVRHFPGSKLEHMLRISIGSPDENEVLLSALKEILSVRSN